MAIKTYRPVTPSRRFMTVASFEELSRVAPQKSLLRPARKTGGRSNTGRITSRHRGGGHKRMFRLVDFRQEKWGVPAKVVSIEYDPNRSARLALLAYSDGEKRYIIVPIEVKVGDVLMAGPAAEIRPGNRLPLEKIPLGVPVYNIELRPGEGGVLARSAGTTAQLMAREGRFAFVRLPSGEVRKVLVNCAASIGQVSNPEHSSLSDGKAGRTRWRGRRPYVRGVAMNPVDHPMGGGEGKSSGGRHPCSPWGKLAKGGKTRKRNKPATHVVRARG